MKTLDPDLQTHLDAAATTLAWCWRITRADGEVFGFTDHDVPLIFDGTNFEPESGLAVDAQDAEGVLSSDRITETDILDGCWDNAVVEVWRVNWQVPGQRVLLRRGNVGQVRRGRIIFVAEVRSMAHVLNQPVGRIYQSTCDARLGDARCQVDLEDAAFRGSGEIISVVRKRAFTASGLESFDDGLFALGTIEWTSGANTGRHAEVMRHEIQSGGVIVTLLEAPVRAIASGDTFIIRAGCDKRIGTCQTQFNNAANFRGFPHIPGQNTVIRYATRNGRNTGEPL
jgi:uncharacterized phage protein (TIGR02218 family)